MNVSRILPFVASGLIAYPLHAQDGGQLYGLYCSACHAPDGTGANAGAFPPLAGSNWIAGNPERTIAIVLKGLQGPVEVAGRSYNLAMPPQGDALTDDQISAILTYVHTAWGNTGQKVSTELVRDTRVKYLSKKESWTGPEILKLCPLEKQESVLTNLISRVYKGPWDSIPDFTRIQSENVEEEHDGLLDTAIAATAERFGIVWEGEFTAPADGEYEFILDADDSARLLLHSQLIAEVKGIGPMGRSSTGKMALKAGANPIRVEYFQATGNQGMSLGWRPNKKESWRWLSALGPQSSAGGGMIPLAPKNGKAAIYRNFIQGSSPRAIGFGFPGEVNLAYSADHLAPAMIWAGDFIDAGLHWTDRGSGFRAPAGVNVIPLVSSRFLPASARFKGYTLDANGNPSFRIQLDGQLLIDTWKPGSEGTLVRTLELHGGTSPLEIPLGDRPQATPNKSTTLQPGQPIAVTYNLK